MLQGDISTALRFRPGRITTIAADARTSARSPTQVAMPIIDRWLDQASERLHLLADALVRRSVRGDQQQRVIAEWRRALVELRTAAQEFNGDGIPIAIEGLRTLAAYIEVTTDPGDTDAESISNRLQELADHNENYEHTKQELTDFRRWARTARTRVDELERLTVARVGDPPSLDPA